MEFLLVQDKNSCTGSFVVLLPCMYVLQPQSVHLFQSFSLLTGYLFPFPEVKTLNKYTHVL
jgi:hypothetical protein